jgi:aminopeptidase N
MRPSLSARTARALIVAAIGSISVAPGSVAQTPKPPVYTHADTLRGSITPQRAWWDVAFYDLAVRVQPRDSSIAGVVGITYRVTRPAAEMQIDLQQPLVLDSLVQDGRTVKFREDGNAYFATLTSPQRVGARKVITAYYHGHPRAAKNPPWDGGFIWRTDSLGRRWVATAVQGLGASAWWPNKDTQADEPDSQRVRITVPDPMIDVSNGRLRHTTHDADGTATYEWFIANPINNYDVSVNAGGYAHFSQIYAGERGPLTLDFWPLSYHLDTAKVQFQQVIPMLACFEHWFGPYPWYKDGYKLVEAPHLGMEHQSAVAYGNRYGNGYLGRDLSHTGLGLQWDFIIVHESAHEWWGNSLTSKDLADMWIHESFANYAEGLFEECQHGKAAGARYIIGTRKNVRNDEPIIPAYGVNAEGSGDMYYKGGNMLHTIRQIVNDDAKWRGILRGLQSTFRHQTVTGKQIEHYMSAHAGVDLNRVFAQYLTTTQIPAFEYRRAGDTLSYHWADVVPGFDMPVRVMLRPGSYTLLHPTTSWQRTVTQLAPKDSVVVDENFYVVARDADAPKASPASPRDPASAPAVDRRR